MTRWLAILALAAGCSTHREESRQADVRATAAVVAEATEDRRERTTVTAEEHHGPVDHDRVVAEYDAPDVGTAPVVVELDAPPDGGPVRVTLPPGRLRRLEVDTRHEAPTDSRATLRTDERERDRATLAADAGVTTHTEAHVTRDVRPGLGFSLTFVAVAAVGLVLAGAAARWAWRRYGPQG